MKLDELAGAMRARERFRDLRAPPGVPLVVRVDGRSFARLTERITQKPFDPRFHAWMLSAADALLRTLDGVLAWTASDEISVLLPKASTLFDRTIEKLVSIAAARTSATFTLAAGEAVEFDARVWIGDSLEDVVDYFAWRQADAARCALGAHAYWALRSDGATAPQATAALEGASAEERRAVLLDRVSFAWDEAPPWQRRGSALVWEARAKEAVNPKTGERVVALRRQLVVHEDLPAGAPFREWVAARACQPRLNESHPVG